MREEFRKELIESGYIRFPLPLHRERALEREERKILETAEPFKLSSASVTEPGRIPSRLLPSSQSFSTVTSVSSGTRLFVTSITKYFFSFSGVLSV